MSGHPHAQIQLKMERFLASNCFVQTVVFDNSGLRTYLWISRNVLDKFDGTRTSRNPKAIVNIPANFIPSNLAPSHWVSITEKEAVVYNLSIVFIVINIEDVYYNWIILGILLQVNLADIVIWIISLPEHTGTAKIRLKVTKLSNVKATPKLANKFAPKKKWQTRFIFSKTWFVFYYYCTEWHLWLS